MFYKVVFFLRFYSTSTYLYADDLAVLVDDVSSAQLVSRLIKRWSDENKEEINYKKCGIMDLRRIRWKSSQQRTQINFGSDFQKSIITNTLK